MFGLAVWDQGEQEYYWCLAVWGGPQTRVSTIIIDCWLSGTKVSRNTISVWPSGAALRLGKHDNY